MSGIDGARKDFAEALRRKAADKKKRKREMAKLGLKEPVKKPGEISELELLIEMRSQFREILDRLDAAKAGSGAPVKFEVTDRDLNGKIKAFRVVRG